jgi:hypothetical protein
MISAPLFIVLLVAAFVAVKYGNVKPTAMFLGVVLGLSLASTSFGPPLLGAIQDGLSMAISGASSVAG